MLGDVLTTSVLLEQLNKSFPEATLDFLIDKPALQVMQGNPFVDNYIIPEPRFKSSTISVLKLALRLRKANYDVVIDVYGKLRSQLITVISRANTRIGWKKTFSSFILTHSFDRVTASKNGLSLAIENRLLLLQPLNVAITTAIPKIYLTEEEKTAARSVLINQGISMDRPLFMISLLGSSESKTYPLSYMAQLIEAIVEMKPTSQILFNYLPSQAPEADVVFNSLDKVYRSNVFVDIYANSLRKFLAITSFCDATIGNEGGAINMSKALEIPSFVIFSPYLKKKNWFGSKEVKHVAVHLADYIEYSESDYIDSKNNYLPYYNKFTPDLIAPALKTFLSTL